MIVKAVEACAVITSAAITTIEVRLLLNQRANRLKRIERHVTTSLDQSPSTSEKKAKPWLFDEVAADAPQIRIRAVIAIVASALADVALVDLKPSLVLGAVVLEVIAVPLVALAEVINKIHTELRQRVAIEANLPLEIEKLALYLGSGLSLNSSFYRLAKTSSPETRNVFTFIAQGLQSGLPLNEVLEECYQRYPTNSIRRITNLLLGGAGGGDLVRVTREEAANQRGVRHLNALAKMEKVTQSVWIPITVAALLPGIAIVFIPFFSILTSLKG
ncbi:MAG: type II secretion system F family protein [Actinomycetota bacterium]|nr:type II secretion system F family protein [Actinomycetota bacterium]